jgi:hypothetical protein
VCVTATVLPPTVTARALSVSRSRARRGPRVCVWAPEPCGSVALRVCGCMCVCGDETEIIKVAVLAREV